MDIEKWLIENQRQFAHNDGRGLLHGFYADDVRAAMSLLVNKCEALEVENNNLRWLIQANNNEQTILNKVDEYIERNLKRLIDHGQRDSPFGVSYVQRLCRIGYNQACHTVERAIEKKALVKHGEYQYRFADDQNATDGDN